MDMISEIIWSILIIIIFILLDLLIWLFKPKLKVSTLKDYDQGKSYTILGQQIDAKEKRDLVDFSDRFFNMYLIGLIGCLISIILFFFLQSLIIFITLTLSFYSLGLSFFTYQKKYQQRLV